MDSQSTSPLSSYFRHHTYTGPPPQPVPTSASENAQAGSTSAAPSSTASSLSSSSPLGTASIASSLTVAPPFTSASVSHAFSLTQGFGNPSAPPTISSAGTDDKPLNSSAIAALATFFSVVALVVIIWLTRRCFAARRKRDEEQGLERPNKEGWAKRLTFTGNKEKFWQRLDDYHESLWTRDQARMSESASRHAANGSVSSMSRVPTFTHHSSRSQTSFASAGAGSTASAAARSVTGHSKHARKRSNDEESFVVGHDEELAYLHTMIDDRQPPPTGPGPTSSWLPYPKSISSGTVPQAGHAGFRPTLPSVLSATSLAESDKRVDTGTTVGKLMLDAPDIPTQVEEPKRKPVKYLSNTSTVPASSFLKPTTFIPMTQMSQTQTKHQSNYRSPTASLYGCYKDSGDTERQASFISTSSSVGSGSGSGNGKVPAVPPIPAEYRK